MLIRVFILSDRASAHRRFRRLLSQPDVLTTGTIGKRRVWQRLARESIDVLVASLSVLDEPADRTVQTLRKLPDAPDIIVLTENEDPEHRATLLSAGCCAVLNPELPDPVLETALSTFVQRRREEALKATRHVMVPQRARLDDFVSESPAMQKLIATTRRVAAADTSLLILGETGVGKERLARAIHSESPRAHGPFVAVNCSAIPESLLESELFGYQKGAFTGALRERRGHFELAHGGTFYLDEVGDLPFAAQAKLLRVLQEHSIQPLGSERTIDVDVRIIAATNRDLKSEIEAKRFRRDLYYRLGVVSLVLPPLRERREDIPFLIESYCQHFARHLGLPVDGVSREALASLTDYPWPGNVRELINVMEHAVLLCTGDAITISDLPDVAAGGVPANRAGAPGFLDSIYADSRAWREAPWKTIREEVLQAAEKEYLSEILRLSAGRIGVAAERAGMVERSLFDKMQRHGLSKEEFRGAGASPVAGRRRRSHR